MSSSLHVSLPDELRAYVDFRTSGTKDYSTPSEYVRTLIRLDMERDAERRYVLGTLFKSMEDIKHGRIYSAAEVEEDSKAFLDSLEDKNA
jgi:antitoxin ParD1/3/4